MIKKYLAFITLIFLFNLKSMALESKPLIIELGDSLKLNSVKESVWIENQKIAKATTVGNLVRVQAMSIGSTRLRVDKKYSELVVLPPGQVISYEKWKTLSSRFTNINIGTCQTVLCLKGQINTLNEFKKILKTMETEKSFVYLGLDISHKITSQIENWYSEKLKAEGFPPFKIIYSKPWKVYSTTNDTLKNSSLFFEKLGVLMIEDKNMIELHDNLRVEIKIVEIKKELARQWGIRWPDAYSAQVVSPNISPLKPFDLLLQASERSGDANILASPNLMCKSGKDATFFAGGEFPIKTIGEKFSSVTWKQYGINLKIKPIIDSIGQISLEIESEVSSIDKSREIDGIPALYSHKVSSHFDLKKSQTIVLSGLIKSESGQSFEGLPFLSQIPILGKLFSSESFLENKTELVIFVTPVISGN